MEVSRGASGSTMNDLDAGGLEWEDGSRDDSEF
jgi:hypothetical protein